MKKRIILLAFLAFTLNLFAQAPQSFNYQAVARNSSGQFLSNQAIGVRFSIIDAGNNLLYWETHTPSTNDLGLFTLSIGGGVPQGGDFETIDWSQGSMTLRVELDPDGGDNYTLDGTTLLESVPYARYAEKAQPSGNANGDLSGDYPSPTVAGIQNRAISSAAPAVGDVLKWNGTVWAPGTDATSGGGFFSAGPGISISGNVISNVGDLSATNEIQTLAVSGNQLSISNGNAVTLPTGTTYTAGNGIAISGNTISANDVSATNEIQTLAVSGNQLSISNGNAVTLPSSLSYWNLNGNNISNNNSGNVGIGTATPSVRLHVKNDNEVMRIDGTNSWLSFYNGTIYRSFIQNENGKMKLGTSDFNSTGNLALFTNGTERMTLTPGGNTGIGTTTPSARLHVKNDNEALRISGAQPYLSFYNNIGGYAGYLWNKDLFNMDLGTAVGNSTGSLTLRTQGNLGIWIDPSGDVGIGRSPGGRKLDVEGSLGLRNLSFSSQWEVFTTSGITFSYNNVNKSHISHIDGDYITISDKSVKQYIQAYREGVLKDLNKLEVSTYLYKDNPADSPRSLGLIAQNVQEYFPEVVHQAENENGEPYLGISYGKVSVIAVKAIQELSEVVDEQQKTIDLQAKEIAELKARMDRMEAMLIPFNLIQH